MPSAGSSHFYRDRYLTTLTLVVVCQCPRRALLISTVLVSGGSVSSDGCVNALGGLFSFLRYKGKYYSMFRNMVSMPSAGSSHFYDSSGSCIVGTRTVSMPSAGSSHFYKDILDWVYDKMCCVNALGGLFSFLQYPLETRINTGFPAPFLQVFV